MRRTVAGLAAAMLFPLAGCGEPAQDYCSELQSQRREIADMVESESPSALLDGLPMLRDLAEKAPDDLSDEWQVYLDALDGLDDALDDAGVKASDFADGTPPTSLSPEERKAIADAADLLATDEVVAASSGIEQQARDVCKVNLGL